MKISEQIQLALQDLEIQGRLTPEDVVKAAKNPKNPLHSHFQWDVKKAAHSHWIETARELIRSVKVVIHQNDMKISTVCYVRDPEMGDKEQGYVSIRQLRTERELAQEALLDEIRRLRGILQRVLRIATALELPTEGLDLETLLATVEQLPSMVSHD